MKVIDRKKKIMWSGTSYAKEKVITYANYLAQYG